MAFVHGAHFCEPLHIGCVNERMAFKGAYAWIVFVGFEDDDIVVICP